ncbi:MAG: hypothetical protein V8T86_11530 [Victivallis sp.]
MQERWCPCLDIWAFLSNHYVGFAADARRREGRGALVVRLPGAARAVHDRVHRPRRRGKFRTWLCQTCWLRHGRNPPLVLDLSGANFATKAPGYPARNVHETPAFFNELRQSSSGTATGRRSIPRGGPPTSPEPVRLAPHPVHIAAADRPACSRRRRIFQNPRKSAGQKRSKKKPAERKQFEAPLEVPADVAVSLYEYNSFTA